MGVVYALRLISTIEMHVHDGTKLGSDIPLPGLGQGQLHRPQGR